MNNKRIKTRNGWILVDFTVSMFITTMLLICLSLTMTATGGYNRLNLTRGQCLSAAQAQMDSLAVRGRLIGAGDMGRLFEGVQISVDRNPGQADWKGLELISISASKQSGKQNVNIKLTRYMPQGKGLQSNDRR